MRKKPMTEPEHFADVARRIFPTLEEHPMARNYRKERGRETEHLVARSFAADGWPHAEAVGGGSPGRDIKGVPGVAVEVKARTKFEPLANLRQAIANAAGDVPLVVLRPTGGGPSNIDDWPAFTTFGQIRALLRAAGYGEPLSGPSELQIGIADLPDAPRRSETPTGLEALAASILRKTI
jgi:hypothetical protein